MGNPKAILIRISNLLILYFTILSCYNIEAGVLDSLGHSLKQKPKFIFSFDARRSFVNNQNAKLSGFKFGLEFDNRIRLGLGIYDLSSPFFRSIPYTDSTGEVDTAHTRLKFGYISPYIEYVLFQNDRWEFSIPLQLGAGSIALEAIDSSGLVFDERPLGILELSITGHYKVFQWIGIGSGVGYRFAFNKEQVVRKSLSSPVYMIKVKVFLGYVYRQIFPKKEKHND